MMRSLNNPFHKTIEFNMGIMSLGTAQSMRVKS